MSTAKPTRIISDSKIMAMILRRLDDCRLGWEEGAAGVWFAIRLEKWGWLV